MLDHDGFCSCLAISCYHSVRNNTTTDDYCVETSMLRLGANRTYLTFIHFPLYEQRHAQRHAAHSSPSSDEYPSAPAVLLKCQSRLRDVS